MVVGRHKILECKRELYSCSPQKIRKKWCYNKCINIVDVAEFNKTPPINTN